MFNFMHAKFQVAGFQNKEIYVIVLSMSSVYFDSDIYWFRGLGGFLPLPAAKFRKVWKISDQSSNMCYLCFLLSETVSIFSVFVECGSVIFQYTNY